MPQLESFCQEMGKCCIYGHLQRNVGFEIQSFSVMRPSQLSGKFHKYIETKVSQSPFLNHSSRTMRILFSLSGTVGRGLERSGGKGFGTVLWFFHRKVSEAWLTVQRFLLDPVRLFV